MSSFARALYARCLICALISSASAYKLVYLSLRGLSSQRLLQRSTSTSCPSLLHPSIKPDFSLLGSKVKTDPTIATNNGTTDLNSIVSSTNNVKSSFLPVIIAAALLGSFFLIRSASGIDFTTVFDQALTQIADLGPYGYLYFAAVSPTSRRSHFVVLTSD
jgi:hypothetical protein